MQTDGTKRVIELLIEGNGRMRKVSTFTAIILATLAGLASAQEVEIVAFEEPGLLMWSNTTLNATCRVEWAASATGPWHRSWTTLTDITVTNTVITRSVPMFYRVVCILPPPEPVLIEITAKEALAMIIDRQDDPEFVILDVRTDDEYTTQHIIGAINIDFFSPSFDADLNALNKRKAYLIYCASSNRSGQTLTKMATMGFFEVYDMDGGIAAFLNVPGSGPYLEP